MDGAAVGVGDFAAEAETEAAAMDSVGGVSLEEAFEDFFGVSGGNYGAGITHRKFSTVAGHGESIAERPVGAVVFSGVGEEIEEESVELAGISSDVDVGGDLGSDV